MKAWIIIAIIALLWIAQPEKKVQQQDWLNRMDDYLYGEIVFEDYVREANIWIYNDLYFAYFLYNPTVRAASYDLLTDTADFWRHIGSLESTGTTDVPVPSDMVDKSVRLTNSEFKDIYSAKMAHSLYIDRNNMVNWDLEDFTEEELYYIFSKDEIFRYSGGAYYFYSIVDHDPSYTFGYLSSHIQSTPTQTLYSFTEDLRQDFRHGSPGLGDPINEPYTMENALTWKDGNGKRVSRYGCHTMGRLTAHLARAVNIPSYWDLGWYEGDNHCSAFFPTTDAVLNHGDDIYSGALRATPVSELLMPYTYWIAEVEPCGKLTFCAMNITFRYGIENAIAYPTSQTIAKCCNPPAYGYVDCADYLIEYMKIDQVYTASEIQEKVAIIQQEC